MIDKMNNTPVDLQKLLQNMFVGATLKSFDWSVYYSISFLIRNDRVLPPELNLTICSNWSFLGLEDIGKGVGEAFHPLDIRDCSRGYVLAGIATKEVASVKLENGSINIKFIGGVVMSIPILNTDDPEEDAFSIRTPEWVNSDKQVHIGVNGSGEIYSIFGAEEDIV